MTSSNPSDCHDRIGTGGGADDVLTEKMMEWPTAMIVIPASRTGTPSSGAVCRHVESVLRRTILRLALISLPLLTAACGTYNLGNVRPQATKTADQQQLDTLTCKDQASLAAKSAGRQTADFFLGLTVVGAPGDKGDKLGWSPVSPQFSLNKGQKI
jgi:hypothetical protein